MRISTKDMILAALFAALTAIGALIRIPVGPVPITLQFFFTALSGILLGPYLGMLSQLIYVLLGLFGVPIFTSGGGFSYILNQGFGYLIGFIIAPLIIGKIVGSQKRHLFLTVFAACIAGILSVYAVGLPYMYIILKYVAHTDITFLYAAEIGFFIFIPGDIAKCAAVSLLSMKIIPALRKR